MFGLCTPGHTSFYINYAPDVLKWLSVLFICLFGVLHHFRHCTGHITIGSSVGTGNQYIQLVKVLYCKLLTIGKQLLAFPHKVWGLNPLTSEVGGECVTTAPPWPGYLCCVNRILRNTDTEILNILDTTKT